MSLSTQICGSACQLEDDIPNLRCADSHTPPNPTVTCSAGRVITVAELRAHDASDPDLPIYLSLGGHVFDVTKSDYFYSVGKVLHCYAGRSITRAVAQGTTDTGEIDRGDDLSGLTHKHLTTLRKRMTFFLGKFDKVGVLEGVEVLRLRYVQKVPIACLV